VYVPDESSEIVVLVPVPVVVISPGFLVNFQIPVDGNPTNSMLPVATVHVGCMIVPIPGDAGGSVNPERFATAVPFALKKKKKEKKKT